jgi:hypothetical protein
MPKTGSSSIQQSLFFGLEDPLYRYYSAGEINGSRMLWTIATPERLAPHHWGGRLSDRVLKRRRGNYLRGFLRQLKIARRERVTTIFSCEDAWNWDPMQIRQIKEIALHQNVQVKIVIYLRPWKSFLESNYQQRMQGATVRFQVPRTIPDFSPFEVGKLDYRKRIELFDHSFGAENVLVRKFDPGLFPEGCVVRDFCHQLGVAIDPEKIRRVNESIGLNAVKMLHAYRQWGNPKTTWLHLAKAQHHQLILALREMPDSPFRMHSQIVMPILDPFLGQVPWLEQRLGVSFQEDFDRHDLMPCLREKSDLASFDESSLRWLAGRSGGSIPSSLSGEETARSVAAMVHRLRHRLPSMSGIRGGLGRVMERAVTRWRKGDS